MATERKSKAHAVPALGVEVQLTGNGTLTDEEERNARLFMSYQFARWCVKTRRKGKWKMAITIEPER